MYDDKIMKQLKESYNEMESGVTSEKIFLVGAIGNFWGGKYYETGLDSFFVLARTPEEAKEIADKNVQVVTQMFKNKILHNKKRALRKDDKTLVKITDRVKETNMSSHKKVLTKDGQFINVNLQKN